MPCQAAYSSVVEAGILQDTDGLLSGVRAFGVGLLSGWFPLRPRCTGRDARCLDVVWQEASWVLPPDAGLAGDRSFRIRGLWYHLGSSWPGNLAEDWRIPFLQNLSRKRCLTSEWWSGFLCYAKQNESTDETNRTESTSLGHLRPKHRQNSVGSSPSRQLWWLPCAPRLAPLRSLSLASVRHRGCCWNAEIPLDEKRCKYLLRSTAMYRLIAALAAKYDAFL